MSRDSEERSINQDSAAHTPSRTGAREAEGSGLLSRPAGHRRVGSNPTPSASEPERFSGASGQREVGPTGNEGRRSGSDQAAAQGRPETLDEFMARHEHVLVSNSVKRIAYVTQRPIDRVLADLNRAQKAAEDDA